MFHSPGDTVCSLLVAQVPLALNSLKSTSHTHWLAWEFREIRVRNTAVAKCQREVALSFGDHSCERFSGVSVLADLGWESTRPNLLTGVVCHKDILSWRSSHLFTPMLLPNRSSAPNQSQRSLAQRPWVGLLRANFGFPAIVHPCSHISESFLQPRTQHTGFLPLLGTPCHAFNCPALHLEFWLLLS